MTQTLKTRLAKLEQAQRDAKPITYLLTDEVVRAGPAGNLEVIERSVSRLENGIETLLEGKPLERPI